MSSKEEGPLFCFSPWIFWYSQDPFDKHQILSICRFIWAIEKNESFKSTHIFHSPLQWDFKFQVQPCRFQTLNMTSIEFDSTNTFKLLLLLFWEEHIEFSHKVYKCHQ